MFICISITIGEFKFIGRLEFDQNNKTYSIANVSTIKIHYLRTNHYADLRQIYEIKSLIIDNFRAQIKASTCSINF